MINIIGYRLSTTVKRLIEYVLNLNIKIQINILYVEAKYQVHC